MRTPVNLSRINTWVKLLLRVKDASRSFGSTSDMIDGLSQNGIRPFVRSIFGYTLYRELTNNYEGDIEEDILTSVRLIQPIAYLEYIDPPKKKLTKPEGLRVTEGIPHEFRTHPARAAEEIYRDMMTRNPDRFVTPTRPTTPLADRIANQGNWRRIRTTAESIPIHQTVNTSAPTDNPWSRLFNENLNNLIDEDIEEELE